MILLDIAIMLSYEIKTTFGNGLLNYIYKYLKQLYNIYLNSIIILLRYKIINKNYNILKIFQQIHFIYNFFLLT